MPHPCKQVVENTWPALSKCCDVFADDERVTERCCRTIRSVVSAAGVGWRQLRASFSTRLNSVLSRWQRFLDIAAFVHSAISAFSSARCWEERSGIVGGGDVVLWNQPQHGGWFRVVMEWESMEEVCGCFLISGVTDWRGKLSAMIEQIKPMHLIWCLPLQICSD